MDKLNIEDVVYVKLDNEVQYVYLSDGNSIAIDKSELDLNVELSKYRCIFECDNIYLINIEYISDIVKNKVTLSHNIVISLSNTALLKLKMAYFEYHY